MLFFYTNNWLKSFEFWVLDGTKLSSKGPTSHNIIKKSWISNFALKFPKFFKIVPNGHKIHGFLAILTSNIKFLQNFRLQRPTLYFPSLPDTTSPPDILVPCQKMRPRHTHFYRQLGCLAFSLRFWLKIKQLLSNCPASDRSFSIKTADFH